VIFLPTFPPCTKPKIQICKRLHFKGHWQEMFDIWFFHQSTIPRPQYRGSSLFFIMASNSWRKLTTKTPILCTGVSMTLLWRKTIRYLL
jgi:hypothetical protein